MKNRKIVLVAFMLVAVMLLSVGYATLTDTLTIIGNAHIDLDTTNALFDKNVVFSDADVVTAECTGSGQTDDVASCNQDDATFTANKLATVDEKSTFLFTITNSSNIDAKITINNKKLSGADNPNNSNAPYFKCEYEYYKADGTTKFGENDDVIVPSHGEIKVKVIVTVLKVPTAATSATFGIELTASADNEVVNP